MFKKVCLAGLAAAAFSFAQDETYVRNICDTLPSSPTPKVELKLAYVDETQWFGSKDMSKTDSSTVKRFEDYESLVPLRNKFSDRIPVSVMAGCAETKMNLVKFAEWSESAKQWTLNTENDDYATLIMDINMVEIPGYNASNSYNLLAFSKGSIPADYSFLAGELLASRTFEFQFDWWYTVAAYRIATGPQSASWAMSSSIAMDSVSSVMNAVEGLGLSDADTVSKIQYQQFHVVLKDANKMVEEVSSSSAGGAGPWNCGTDPLLSCSSTYLSSSSMEESSSSEGTTGLCNRDLTPRIFNNSREVRRLDGSRVRANESLEPGIYYVKGVDGRWIKKVQLR